MLEVCIDLLESHTLNFCIVFSVVASLLLIHEYSDVL